MVVWLFSSCILIKEAIFFKQLDNVRVALADAKKKADEGALQQLEEWKKKAQRDLEVTQKALAEMEVARDRIERSKRKLQQEVFFIYIYGKVTFIE